MPVKASYVIRLPKLKSLESYSLNLDYIHVYSFQCFLEVVAFVKLTYQSLPHQSVEIDKKSDLFIL